MNRRDIERLSEYLDGRLRPSDSARLETRLASDPALASALDALREARTLLRQLPHRRAPRNFTLTPKMVGLKPPLPRAYPLLRFATVAAVFLFVFSFINLRPITMGASAPAPAAYETEGEDAAEAPMLEMAVPEVEATQEAAILPPEATPLPAEATQEVSAIPPDATPPPPDEGANRTLEEPPSAKSAGEPAPAPPLLSTWQIILAAIAILGAGSMLLIRHLAAKRWREK